LNRHDSVEETTSIEVVDLVEFFSRLNNWETSKIDTSRRT